MSFNQNDIDDNTFHTVNENEFTEEDNRFDELEEANRVLREEMLEMRNLLNLLRRSNLNQTSQTSNTAFQAPTTPATASTSQGSTPIASNNTTTTGTTTTTAAVGITVNQNVTTGTNTNNIADFFGLNDLRDVLNPRTSIEMELGGISLFSGKERDGLTLSERAKVYDKATAGMKNGKYKPLIDLNGLESLLTLENIVAFEDLNIELSKHLTVNGMINVFYILNFDLVGNPLPHNPNVNNNLIKDFHTTTIDEILKTTKFFLSRGSDYHVENLKWSFDSIMNSCNDVLKDILRSKMQKYPVELHTGPVLFYHLVEQLTCSSPEAIRLVTNNLTTLTMNKFEGDSIPLATKFLRAGFKWLTIVNKMIPDPETVTINLFKTSSVSNFTQFLDVLSTNAKLNNILLSYDYVMTHCEEKYKDMVLNKDWDLSRTSSSFYGGKGKGNNPTPPTTPNSDFAHPKAGEPEVKTIRNNEWKFCSICKRWRRNKAAHTTSEHIGRTPGPNNDNPTTPSPNSTLSPTPLSDSGATQFQRNPVFQQSRNVRFIGGL